MFDVLRVETVVDPSTPPLKMPVNGTGYGPVWLVSPFADRRRWKDIDQRVVRAMVTNTWHLFDGPDLPPFWAQFDHHMQGILNTGAEPLLCLHFLPDYLAQDGRPGDYAEWRRLVGEVVRHCLEKGYGVRYWEILNEPNCAWNPSEGAPIKMTVQEYAEYYEHTVTAIKHEDPDAMVGGSTTNSLSFDHSTGEWLACFMEACGKRGAPLDFVSWHAYHNLPGGGHSDMEQNVSIVRDMLRKAGYGHAEIVIDEWAVNACWSADRDSHVGGSYVAAMMSAMIKAGVDISCVHHTTDPVVSKHVGKTSEWARSKKAQRLLASEVDEKTSDSLVGCCGLISWDGIPKASYNVFRLLAWLARDHVYAHEEHEDTGMIVTGSHGRITVLVWNFPEENSSNRAGRKCRLVLRGLGDREKFVVNRFVVDKETANAAHDVRRAELELNDTRFLTAEDGGLTIDQTVSRYGVVFLELKSLG